MKHEDIYKRLIFQNVAYGVDENQKIGIIIPQKENVHAIVYIHGGAYLAGDKSQYPSFLLDYSKCNICATINYRLLNTDNNVQMTDILSDVNDALEKIIELSDENNVNIQDFILVGHSAGGHIGLLYGYEYFQKNEKINIVACISLAGPTDFTDDFGWSSMKIWNKEINGGLSFFSQIGTKLTGHTIELTQNNWTKQTDYCTFEKYIVDISPIMYVKHKTGNVPPTLLIYARSDDQVPYSNAVRLIRALDHTSVPHKLITPTGRENNHMLGGEIIANNMPITFKEQIWVIQAKKWIEKYL